MGMTLKEQIMKLQTYKMYEGEDTVYVELDDILKLIEQQPCDDCVSREQALEAMDTWDKFGYTDTGCFVREPKGDYVPYVHYDDMVKCIKNLPPVKPQRAKGKWLDKKMTIKGAHGMAYGRYGCSVCKKKQPSKTDFCPCCGADMRGGENDNK